MIQNKTKASEYRVRTLDRNDLNEKGEIFIGQGGTTTVDKVEGVSNVAAANIIDAINGNQTDDKYVQLKDENNLKTYLLKYIYPIGSIYITTGLISPQVLLGGTWEVFGQGRTLVGVDPQDKTGKYTATGKTGGEETHTLTTSEMPSHSHYYTKLYSSGFVGNIGSSGDVLTSTNELTQAEGGGQPHNNMPPYITVYMYKRTA